MQAEVDKIYSKSAIFAYTSRAAGSFGGSLLGLLGTERGTKMVSMYERERERERELYGVSNSFDTVY